jgi:DHA1 family bicyclomycin/chloramphenicol resistance-like MFS transporter
MFGPATAGLMLGSALAGRAATRWGARTTLGRAFAIMAVANLYNLAVCLVEPAGVGWYVAYLLVFNFGMSLAVPTMTVRGLDCVPGRRGMGSSVQLFVQTSFNALIAGVLAPLMWTSRLSLAVAAACLFAVASLGTLLAARHPR